MSKASFELKKKNNEREELISEENDEMYTDMIVYLRYADISEYNQELVRADLIELILDGQERGDDIAAVMGSRYKEICDEIIENMPRRTLREKVVKRVDECLCMFCALGISVILMQFITGFAKEELRFKFTMTWGYFISMFLIVGVTELIIAFLKKSLFEETVGKRKKTLAVREWLVFCALYAVIIAPIVLLQKTMFTLHIAVAALILAVLFAAERVIARIY